MSIYKNLIRREFKLHVSAFKDDRANKKDRHFFRYSGTQIYCGRQGSGKTISAVRHAHQIKAQYPYSIFVSNLKLTSLEPIIWHDEDELREKLKKLDRKKQYIFFSDLEKLSLLLTKINNGKYGVIYLIDEIHTYFNALDSKNIPMFIFTEISQQRKQRKLIIGTSQLFMRMAKPFREQCDTIIICNTMFNKFTSTKAFDGMTLDLDYDGNIIGRPIKSGFFWQSREIRNLYDTYQKVVSGAEQYDLNRNVTEKTRLGKVQSKAIVVKK